MEEKVIKCSNCGQKSTVKELKEANPDIKIIGGKVPRYATCPKCGHSLTVTLFL